MPTTPSDRQTKRRSPHPDEKLEQAGVLSKPAEMAWEALGMAEFPIVTTAVKRPSRDTLDFAEKSTRKGSTQERGWRMVGSSEYGLPRLYDLDLYVALLVLAERTGYEKRLVKTTIHELCTLPGLTPGGATYARIRQGARRFIHTGYSARGVFWPEGAKEPVAIEEWHILAEARLMPSYQDPAIADGLPPSYILFGEKFLNITKRQQRKPINLGLWSALGTGLAKPLYHYLDTALYGRDRFEIGLNRLGNHIGQTRRYAPSQAMRLYQPYLERFVDLGFLHSFEIKPSRSKDDPRKVILFPGERARRRRGKAVQVPDVPEEANDAAEGQNRRNTRRLETDTHRQLARRFFEKRHGLDDKTPTRSHLDKAAAILKAAGDFETAAIAVDQAAILGRKNAAESEDGRGYPDDLGGVLNGTFIDEARALKKQQEELEKRTAEQEREAAQARAEHEAYTAWVAEKIEQLKATGEYATLYQEQLDRAKDVQRTSNTSWRPEMVEQSARSWTRRALEKTRFTRAHWRRDTMKDDAATSS